MSKLSVSDLLPYLACHYAGQTRLQQNAWAGGSNALYLGTALHQHMEWLMNGRNGEPPLLSLDTATDQKSLEAMIEAVKDWTPPWTMHGVELKLEAPLFEQFIAPKVNIPDYMLTEEEKADSKESKLFGPMIVGTLDGLGEDTEGRFWSIQWKTIGKGRNIGAELERVRMSPHEITYHWLVKQALDIDLAGTVVGLFRKSLTKKEVEQGVPVFQLYELYRTPEEAKSAFYSDIGPAFNDLYDSIYGEETFQERRNWTACYGPFGNSPCPIFQSCHNGLPIEVCGLVELEDRYSPEEPE